MREREGIGEKDKKGEKARVPPRIEEGGNGREVGKGIKDAGGGMPTPCPASPHY